MQFLLANGAMQTTSAFAKVTTGTSTKTMQQIKPVVNLRIIEWGYSFDASAAATPGQIELIETATVFATVTANVAADSTQQDAEALLFNSNSTFFSYGTSATGFTSSAEGSITASRNLGGPQQTAPTNQFVEQFPLGAQPVCQTGDSTRTRATFGTAVNAYTYVICTV